MNDLKYLDLHGDRVAYRDEGSGEVLLLIHGMAGSSDAWRELIPRLAKSYRVVAPDLLGQTVVGRHSAKLAATSRTCRMRRRAATRPAPLMCLRR